jgi:2-polyprenyl-3-methyl-5-hydroxy-6-metoxy-1,4-benzoquinol methylase
MPLTAEEQAFQKDHFRKRTAQFQSQGYDRFEAASFILDQAGALAGPVLDIGTGMGITARALARWGLDVVTVDMAAHDQQVAVCLTDDSVLLRRIRFAVADGARLPFRDNCFKGVVAVDVLHHLDVGEPVLAEMFRVIEPGGLVVLADFSAEGFALVSRVHGAEGRVHAVGPVTMDGARDLLCGLGMTELRASVGHMHRVSVLLKPTASAAAGRSAPGRRDRRV